MLRGFTGADAEIYEGDGFRIANVRLATDEGYTNRDGEKVEHTEWHNLVAKNKLADVFEKYITKGSHIDIEGRLRTESWDDNGTTRYRTKVIVTELAIISTPGDGEDAGTTEAKPSRAKTTTKKASRTRAKAKTSKAKATAEDDLPY